MPVRGLQVATRVTPPSLGSGRGPDNRHTVPTPKRRLASRLGNPPPHPDAVVVQHLRPSGRGRPQGRSARGPHGGRPLDATPVPYPDRPHRSARAAPAPRRPHAQSGRLTRRPRDGAPQTLGGLQRLGVCGRRPAPVGEPAGEGEDAPIAAEAGRPARRRQPRTGPKTPRHHPRGLPLPRGLLRLPLLRRPAPRRGPPPAHHRSRPARVRVGNLAPHRVHPDLRRGLGRLRGRRGRPPAQAPSAEGQQARPRLP